MPLRTYTKLLSVIGQVMNILFAVGERGHGETSWLLPSGESFAALSGHPALRYKSNYILYNSPQELTWSLTPHVFFRWSSNNPVTLRAGCRLTARGRGRVVRGRGRGGASGWLTSRSVIPASAVPEELIAQAQVVLQDKSRAAIVRELQRTVSSYQTVVLKKPWDFDLFSMNFSVVHTRFMVSFSQPETQ